MKRKLSVLLIMVVLISMATPVLAYYDPYGNYYNNNTYWGENYYNTNYSNSYYGNYYMSSWFSDLQEAYEPTWYEQPQRPVLRGEAFLLYLRAVQKALDRQGYSRLMSGYNNVPFTDINSVNPYAQSEVSVLYNNGILLGYKYWDNYGQPYYAMEFNKQLCRAEMAAIYSRFNRIFFNMGQGYNQYNYDGYNNYYNNNYNNYYNQYMYNDINGHWAAMDIITATSNGAFNGVGNGYFNPDEPLTIEQVWKTLDNCVGFQGLRRSDIAYAMSQTFKVKFDNIDEYYVSNGNSKKITRITSSVSSTTINEGQTKTIELTIYPSDADYKKMSWSTNSRYVSVEESWSSSNGKAYVTIYGREASSSYIKLTGNALDGSGKSVTINVKVNSTYNNDDYYDYGYITSLTLSEDTIYLQLGESKQINVKVKPTNAANKNLGYVSNNSNIAYASNVYVNGSYSYATIVGNNVGETYIQVKAQDGSGESELLKVVVQGNSNVESFVTSAVANPSSVNLNVGNAQYVSVTLYPTTATNKNITWRSDNTNVARIESDSNTGLRIIGVAPGSTNVRGIAANGNTVCTIPVTVTSGYIPNPNPGVTDTVAPMVQLTGADNVPVGGKVTFTVKAFDDNLKSFIITERDILNLAGALSISKIEKIAVDTYIIELMGVEVAAAEPCIRAGVAVDTVGNVSASSNGVVVYINSGE